MEAIKAITSCAAAGQHLEAGKVYRVPEEVSAKDAAFLARIGRVEAAKAPRAPKRKPQRAETDE